MKMESRIGGIIVEKDKESRILGCNHVFLEYAGLTHVDQVLGLTDHDLIWAEYADVFHQHEAAVRAGNDHSIVFPSKTTLGLQIFLHSKTANYNSLNEVTGVHCVVLEIMNPSIHHAFAYLLQHSPSDNQTFSVGKKDNFALTQREKDILFFLTKAKTAKEIARILSISPRTVYSHVENIKLKLNCHTKSELVDMAYQTGLAYELPSSFSNELQKQG
jgi:DNA-binding CsgD family transcriptional regulator